MYENLSSDYDRFVNWGDRLAYEMPFVETLIAQLQKKPGDSLAILDTACGTGMHAITLAQRGHRVSAADLYPQMVQIAKENARRAGVEVRFESAGFGDMQETFGAQKFDLLLCMGNSLPHLIDEAGLRRALLDFAAVLHPSGMLLIQNRNFDMVLRGQQRWMEPQVHREGADEWIFQRFYDFLADGLIRFNIVTLKRHNEEGWQARVDSTLLRPQLQRDLEQALTGTGFGELHAYGSMQGKDFDSETSGNLIQTGTKI